MLRTTIRSQLKHNGTTEFKYLYLLKFLLSIHWYNTTYYSLSLSAAKMIPIFMMFAGGPLGSGKQWYDFQYCLLEEYMQQGYMNLIKRYYLLLQNFILFLLVSYRFSWIHLEDIVNLIYEALRNPSYKGRNLSIWQYTPVSTLVCINCI